MGAMTETCIEIIGIEERLDVLGKDPEKNKARIAELRRSLKRLTGRIGDQTNLVLGC